MRLEPSAVLLPNLPPSSRLREGDSAGTAAASGNPRVRGQTCCCSGGKNKRLFAFVRSSVLFVWFIAQRGFRKVRYNLTKEPDKSVIVSRKGRGLRVCSFSANREEQ